MDDHMSYIPERDDPIPIDTEGAKRSVSSHDEAILQVNQDIKSELQKLVFHMGLMNDLQIDDGDLDD
jgi:hypothetical protein